MEVVRNEWSETYEALKRSPLQPVYRLTTQRYITYNFAEARGSNADRSVSICGVDMCGDGYGVRTGQHNSYQGAQDRPGLHES